MKNRNFTFRTVIEPDDPKGYHGFVPALPGVHTCGDTIEQVKINLRDAITCHIEGLIKAGEEIPWDNDSVESLETFSEKDFSNAVYA